MVGAAGCKKSLWVLRGLLWGFGGGSAGGLGEVLAVPATGLLMVPPQEVEALLGETRMLQGKLQSQEDDFRLQNSTLLRELAKVGIPAAPRDPNTPFHVPQVVSVVAKATLRLLVPSEEFLWCP